MPNTFTNFADVVKEKANKCRIVRPKFSKTASLLLALSYLLYFNSDVNSYQIQFFTSRCRLVTNHALSKDRCFHRPMLQLRTNAQHQSPTQVLWTGTSPDNLQQSHPPKLWMAPLCTMSAALVGIVPSTQPIIASTIGSLIPMQSALAVLMLAMGLTITPAEVRAATQQPRVLLLNILCCFGFMPLLAIVLARTLHFSSPHTICTVLIGSVSGGQASNLFTLLAGGDVALSVVCTLSTTLLGVVATPILIQMLLGYAVPVQALGVLKSVASLVLLPLVSGLFFGQVVPEKAMQCIIKHCPKIGLVATMILVAGGASNAATTSLRASSFFATLVGAVLLPLLGAAIGLLMAVYSPGPKIPEASKRTLVVEVLSKSPTLAHVLALKHFGVAAASIPATAMVSLAVLGALVASIWQTIPIKSET